MSENRILRDCYIKKNRVPSISVMKKYMKPALAHVYFKSMDQKLKVIAGLEPPLKGGGGFWYIPPKDLLQNKSVLKPLNAEYLTQLGWCGMDEIAMKKMVAYRSRMETEIQQALLDKDEEWKLTVTNECQIHWRLCIAKETKVVSEDLAKAFTDFTVLYTTSLTNLEKLLADAAIKKIKETRNKALREMKIKYKDLLQKQAVQIANKYSKKLSEEKEKLKEDFVHDLEKRRTAFYDKLHNINLEKHVAVEKLRHFLECEKTGCQIYVALKERQECLKELDLAKHKHRKENDRLTKKIHFKDLHILRTEVKEKRQDDFIKIWQKKVCHVVKNFQMFILYCLKMMPEQADFFINMEKIMLIQLNDSLEDPIVDSIFESDNEQFHSPIPNPHPFYIFCEKRNQPHVHKQLCPKHCTSSASQFPIIVINKRCIYSDCDNFEQFTDKIKDYVDDNILNDDTFEDYNYEFARPVKYPSSQQFRELKLESSIMQVLEQEIANIQDVSFVCPVCRIPHCYECNRSAPHSPKSVKSQAKPESLSSIKSVQSVYLTLHEELTYTKGSNWESYLKYVQPKKCDCSKLAKKHLLEHLPAYMRKMSYYDAPELLNYEPCSALELKTLVKTTKGKQYTKSIPTKPKMKDVACQYTDFEYKYLCSCFSNDDVGNNLIGALACHTLSVSSIGNDPFKIVADSSACSYLSKSSRSFVEARILSLRRLMQSREIQEIFKRNDCKSHV